MLFRSVIFTRAENSAIARLKDLRGHSFMAVDASSLGGWLMARRLLRRQGMEPEDLGGLSFGGTHDAVVAAVREGRAAAGTVRSDTLERMAAEGKIDLDDFRIIHPRYPSRFPFRVSTRLYPEWPFARLPSADPELAHRVAVALLRMPADSPAARRGRNRGWTVPRSYQPVRTLMQDLRIGAFGDRTSLWEVVRRHALLLTLALLGLAALVVVTLALTRLNRRLRRSEELLEGRVRERTAQLEASERMYRAIINGAREGFWMIDSVGFHTLEVNEALCRMLGYSREEMLGHTPFEFVDTENRNIFEVQLGRIPESRNRSYRIELTTKRGRKVPVLIHASTYCDEDGEPLFAYAFIADMSPYQEAEESLRRANRILQALSRSNRALLHAEDEQELLDEVCRIAVEEGGYPLAAVAYVQTELPASVRPVAWAGEEGGGEIAATFQGACDRGPMWGCPPAEAVAEGHPVTHHDLARMKEAPKWCRLARDRGLGSMIALPLTHGEVHGALVIFARKAEAFDTTETDLLMELGGDLGFGIRDLRIREEREEHLHRLRQSATVFESTAEGVTITDPDERIVAVNPAFTTITGYTEQEVLGDTPRALASGLQGKAFYQAMWRSIISTDSWQGEIWNRRKDGEVYPEYLTISAVRDEDGTLTNYVGVFADITEVKRSQQELDFLANHDPLTELPNRRLFNDRLEHALQLRRRDGEGLAVLFLDLDGFKNINDTLGHPAGDQVLQVSASRLQERSREADTLARIGGDEFLVLLETVASPAGAGVVAQKMLEGFREPIEVEGQLLSVGVSIGISLFPEDGGEPASLIKNADAALFRAKESGRNQYQYYTEELTATASERLYLERALKDALDREELELFYQPQVELDTGRIVGAEALVRWNHPDMGLVSPARFIPVAEDTGLILPIGEWVLEAACAQARLWAKAGHRLERMAVNVSAVQVQRQDLPGLVARIAREKGMESCMLEMEVTEASFMSHTGRAIEVLGGLREQGVELAIDDFGTGYASLGYLKNLPVDTLKIDKSFVGDTPEDSSDAALVRTILAMGRSLGLKVVAEGVETEAQARFLVQEGCGVGQGYLYSPPVPARDFEILLSRQGEG